MTNNPLLSQHPFYTIQEAALIRKEVLNLDKEWIDRAGGFLPIYTLGTASYLDASKENDLIYRNKAKQTNPILWSHFEALYKRLCTLLNNILHIPVALDDSLAYPGFHIFLGNKKFEKPIASCHFDLQFKSIDWNHYRDVDFDHPISFTCPFSLPKSGSGLNYWNIEKQEYLKSSSKEIEALRSTKETLFLPYTIGTLVLHQGLILHQIAPSKDITSEDERITLQGHGLFCDGIMRIYW